MGLLSSIKKAFQTRKPQDLEAGLAEARAAHTEAERTAAADPTDANWAKVDEAATAVKRLEAVAKYVREQAAVEAAEAAAKQRQANEAELAALTASTHPPELAKRYVKLKDSTVAILRALDELGEAGRVAQAEVDAALWRRRQLSEALGVAYPRFDALNVFEVAAQVPDSRLRVLLTLRGEQVNHVTAEERAQSKRENEAYARSMAAVLAETNQQAEGRLAGNLTSVRGLDEN